MIDEGVIIVSKRNEEPDYEVYRLTVINRVQCVIKLLNEYYFDVRVSASESPLSNFDVMFKDYHTPDRTVGFTVRFEYITNNSIIDICNDFIRRYRQLLKNS